MNRLKNENGSITLYILLTMLFFLIFITGIYISVMNNKTTELETTKRIKEIYESEVNDMDTAYTTILNKMTPGTQIGQTENGIMQISDGTGITVPVPEGFSYLTGTKETGFVIKNDEDQNEFVWIPVDLIEEGYGIKEWNKGQLAEYYTEYYDADTTTNESIISEITNSVNQYSGYYIGRYEIGITTQRIATGSVTTPILCKPTTVITPIYAYNYVTWEQALNLANGLYNKTDNNVQSRLINARSWDTALKFIAKVDSAYPTDSKEKGWYSTNASNNANYETGKSIDLTNETIPNMIKNIYDMGGNLYEWTAEQLISDTTIRCARGGCYNNLGSTSAGLRYNYIETNSSPKFGFRLALYL